MYAFGVLAGLFLSSVPSIFGLDTNDAFETNATGVWEWLWPVIFASSFAPAAVMSVIGEDVLKETSSAKYVDKQISCADELLVEANDILTDLVHDPVNVRVMKPVDKTVNIWYYLFVESLVQEITIFALLWLDCVPQFGTEDNMQATLQDIGQGWMWFFGQDGASGAVTCRALIFVGCYTCMSCFGSYYNIRISLCFVFFFVSLTSIADIICLVGSVAGVQILKYTEGATWSAIVGALSTPLAAIFWLFFDLNSDTNYFGWHPSFDSSSIYVIAGLLVMSPFIYFYDRASS